MQIVSVVMTKYQSAREGASLASGQQDKCIFCAYDILSTGPGEYVMRYDEHLMCQYVRIN